MSTLPTVKELNEIHREWMELQADDPEPKKQRVFRLMESLPRSYISASPDLTHGAPMIDGAPMWGESRAMREAVEYIQARAHRLVKSRADVVWIGSVGQWAALP